MKKEMKKLNKKLLEIKVILSQAEKTNGQSLQNIESWNDYHDEQTKIEAELRTLDLSQCKITEHYAR